jgi:5-methylcytosine-specific restriction endonuclease McrA
MLRTNIKAELRSCTTCSSQFYSSSVSGPLPLRCNFCKQRGRAWVLRHCIWCGDLFGATHRDAKTCSSHCRVQLSKPHAGIRAEGRQETKACAYCKAEFRTSNSVKIYCSLKCTQKGRPWKPEGMSAKTARSGYAQRRREAQRTGDKDLTTYTIWKAEGGHCRLCNKATIDPTTPRKLKPAKRDAWASLDHIVPLSAGGTHTWANAQLLCYPCNSGKVHTDAALYGRGGHYSKC